ncbi:MAG: creatininase family protein [Gemmatimonadota bacterium]|nr:creatininase family protein [Gemmatimonadota bacterium]
MRRIVLGVPGALLAVSVLAGSVEAQQPPSSEQLDERERRYQEEMAMPRPIEAVSSVWIDELTWLEVRDRIREGYTTAIVPTGGIEQNGPYLTTGKHNVILEALCPAIAEKLGNALCAPVVPFVPEGDIDPPTGAMRYPGTITVRDATYEALLEDIGASLGAHGFTDVVYIGDSGGNQTGMANVAERLTERWKGSGRRAHFVREFYSPGWEETERYTEEVLGIAEGEHDGYHDDIWVTAFMAVVDPETIRWDQRVDAGLASINGVSLVPLQRTIDLGERIVEFRAEYTVKAIREAIQQGVEGR